MARKRSEKQRTRRAELRTQLQGASYNQLRAMLSSGKISAADIRTFYSDARADMVRQIKRIGKSDVEFVEAPKTPPRLSEIKNPYDVAKAAADVNRFISNKATSTVVGRRKVRDKAIETLHKRGITTVNKENYNQWVRFARWYEVTASIYKYGSASLEVLDVFEDVSESGADTGREFQELFYAWEYARTAGI